MHIHQLYTLDDQGWIENFGNIGAHILMSNNTTSKKNHDMVTTLQQYLYTMTKSAPIHHPKFSYHTQKNTIPCILTQAQEKGMPLYMTSITMNKKMQQ